MRAAALTGLISAGIARERAKSAAASRQRWLRFYVLKRPVKGADQRQRVARIALIAADTFCHQLRAQVGRVEYLLCA